jgi:SSS family solute:Na+ symporter
MSPLDLAVILGYAALIVGLGCTAGRGRKRGDGAENDAAEGYFLAGGTLRWPMIGLALFSTNISTVHLVGLAEAGYRSGLLMGNFELLAGVTLIVLALFFVPFYLRARVVTLPDFLEQRYDRTTRDIVAVLSLLSAVFIHIGFSLYTGALVLNGIFDIQLPLWLSVVTIAALTGLYTIVGGLSAVVITESIQAVILIFGALAITFFAWLRVGGWSEVLAHVPAENLTLLRSGDESGGLPWISVLLGYPIIGIWYWCTDQTIVQRVLGAEDENQARAGALFAGFLKLLPIFVLVLPGVLAYTLVEQQRLGAGTEVDPASIYSLMIRELLPTGLKGLMAAALLAAVMSTVASALNSIGTVVSYDFVRRFYPSSTDRQLVTAGRWTTFIALVLSIVWSLSLNPDGIFQAINAMITYIAPPMTCVFLLGVFWRRASTAAANATLAIGIGAGLVVFLLERTQPEWWVRLVKEYQLDFLFLGVLLFALCLLVMIVTSLCCPHSHTVKSAALVWDSPLEPLRAVGWRGWRNYKVQAGVLLVAIAAIYATFS